MVEFVAACQKAEVYVGPAFSTRDLKLCKTTSGLQVQLLTAQGLCCGRRGSMVPGEDALRARNVRWVALRC